MSTDNRFALDAAAVVQQLTLRDTDADKAYGWVWHNDREALVKQARQAVA